MAARSRALFVFVKSPINWGVFGVVIGEMPSLFGDCGGSVLGRYAEIL